MKGNQTMVHNTWLEQVNERLRCSDMAHEQLLLAYAHYELTGRVDWQSFGLAFRYARTMLPGRYEKIVEQLQKEQEEDES